MSNRGMPSLVALLGLLAVAGYQNRDKISEMLGAGNQASGGSTPPGAGAGSTGAGSADTGVLGKLGSLLGGASAGSWLSGGLGELVDRFRQNGHGEAADSWVRHGPNQDMNHGQLAQALGPDMLKTLSEHTGLSTDEVLARLTRELPAAVNSFTPDGRLPTSAEASRLV